MKKIILLASILSGTAFGEITNFNRCELANMTIRSDVYYAKLTLEEGFKSFQLWDAKHKAPVGISYDFTVEKSDIFIGSVIINFNSGLEGIIQEPSLICYNIEVPEPTDGQPVIFE